MEVVGRSAQWLNMSHRFVVTSCNTKNQQTSACAMAANVLRPNSRYICQICRHAVQQAPKRRHWTPITSSACKISTSVARGQTRNFSRTSRRNDPTVTAPTNTEAATTVKGKTSKTDKSFWENQWTIFSASNAALVKKAQAFGDEILGSKTIPDEKRVLEALKMIESAAYQLTSGTKSSAHEEEDEAEKKSPENGPASMLLNLDQKHTQVHPASISIAVDLLSTLAHKLVTFPPVFLNPAILKSYVAIQSALHRPQTFPEIFHLYANKPAPVPGTSDPIKYRQPNPNGANQAIPTETADLALQSAIKAKELELALDIIETSFAARAFRRSKFVKKALPVLSGLSLSPFAAYILAQPLLSQVPTVDPDKLMLVTFVGILTYIGTVSSLGFIAITTKNDQMERVTWAQGTPLLQRWLREEERAGVDKVAMAWGFKDVWRRGEEEGEEWVALKEWAGFRRMEVDKVELMDGME
jgi:hypothetical protein